MPMLTDEKLAAWFVYHPPTEDTLAKHEALYKAGDEFALAMRDVIETCRSATHSEAPTAPQAHDLVNIACRSFAMEVDKHAPDCADKAAAFRCIRLARMHANLMIRIELQAPHKGHVRGVNHMQQLLVQIQHACFQAQSAVACGGV